MIAKTVTKFKFPTWLQSTSILATVYTVLYGYYGILIKEVGA